MPEGLSTQEIKGLALTLSINSAGTKVLLGVADPAGGERAFRSSSTLDIFEEDNLRVQGTGFKPTSSVTGWLFSAPISLGTVSVGMNGEYDGKFILPKDVKAGKHSLQINGISADGRIHSLTIGIVVLPKPKIEKPTSPESPIVRKTLSKVVLFKSGSITLDRTERRLLLDARSAISIDSSLSCVALLKGAKPSKSMKRIRLARAKSACSFISEGNGVKFEVGSQRLTKEFAIGRTSVAKPHIVQISLTYTTSNT